MRNKRQLLGDELSGGSTLDQDQDMKNKIFDKKEKTEVISTSSQKFIAAILVCWPQQLSAKYLTGVLNELPKLCTLNFPNNFFVAFEKTLNLKKNSK